MALPRVVFFVNPELWPKKGIPESPDLTGEGGALGIHCWIIQTYQQLRRAGYECELSSVLPEDGIIVMHRHSCDYGGINVQAGRRRLIVSVAGDYGHYHPANLNVVQNWAQAQWFKRCFFLPHWPQPGLRPRVPSERFRNVAYYGERDWLADELQSDKWEDAIRAMDLEWNPGTRRSWEDYTEVDAVVAVRRFTARAAYDHKPPSKLINCWLAGVPAILGAESAYRSLRRSELDFIEVHSPRDALDALRELKQDPGLRSAMVENGLRRASDYSVAAVTQRWIYFLNDVAVPCYHHWVSLSPHKQRLSTYESRLSVVAGRAWRLLATGRWGWI